MNPAVGPALVAPEAPTALTLWADDQQVATLAYEPRNDHWSLNYAAPWLASPTAFPLSPALALDTAATSYRVSKANIYLKA